jgi:ribosomal-protein-alanine N-acetyltransferase
MAPDCRIRAASSADLAAVAEIERASFPDPWSIAAFGTRLEDVFLVADGETGLVGYAVAWCLAPEAEILNLAVAPRRRQRGTGRALLDAVLAALAAGGARHVFLEVRESNRAARRLYAGAGFGEVGRRRGYYEHPREDALVLARAVPPQDPAA